MARDLQLQVLLNAVDRVTAPLRRITQSSGAAAQAMKASREQLKQLNAQQRDISSFRTLKSANQETAAAMAASQAKVKELAQAIAAAEAPSRKLSAAFNRAQREAQALKQKHGEQQRELQGLRSRLGEAGISTRSLGTHERELRQRIADTNRTIDQHTERLRRATLQQQRLANAQKSYDRAQAVAGKLAAGGAAMAATGATMGAPIVSMVRNYASFEDAMLGVAKQVEGARDSGGKLTAIYYEMGERIKEMATRIPMATTEIAALVEAGARMGIQGKDNLLRFAETTAIAATAFDLPVEEVGDNMGKIANLYKVPIENIGQLGDAINWLDDNALSKGGDIIDVMQRMAGIATSVGMSFKEAAALGSTFLTMGATSEVAGTAANAMIRELSIAQMQSKSFQKGLGMLGLNAAGLQKSMTKDATGTLIKTLEAIKKLNPEKQMTAATLLFGKEFGDDAAKLANNLDEYRRQLKLVNDEESRGSMLRESEAKNQNLSARWTMLQNKLFNQSSSLGATLVTPLTELMDTVGGLVDQVSAWTKANPELTATLVKAGAVLGSLAVAGGTLALVIAGLVGPLAMIKLSLAAIGISAGVAMGPLLLIIAAVAGLAGAAYLIYRNWAPIKAFFAQSWQQMLLDTLSALGAIGRALLNWSPLGIFYRMFAGVLNWFGIELPAKFTEFGANIIQGLINGFTSRFPNAAKAIGEVADGVAGWFKEKLGIHSPSRVFAQLGGFTMQGLEQGLVAGQDGPMGELAEFAKRMTKAGAIVLGVAAGPMPALADAVPQPVLPELTQEVRHAAGPLPERLDLAPLVQELRYTAGALPQPLLPERMQEVLYAAGPLPERPDLAPLMQELRYTAGTLLQPTLPELPALTQQLQVTFADLPRLEALLLDSGRIDNRPPLAAAGAAPTIIVQGDTITLHVSAAGGNPADLVQQINRILDERERAKAARVRSRLHDQE
ncbi:phage tail tape measure protein [Azotobacter vinelandii]